MAVVVGPAVEEDEIGLSAGVHRLADLVGDVALVAVIAHDRAGVGVVVAAHTVLLGDDIADAAVVVASAVHDAVTEGHDGLAAELTVYLHLGDDAVVVGGAQLPVGEKTVVLIRLEVAVVREGVEVALRGRDIGDIADGALGIVERRDHRACSEYPRHGLLVIRHGIGADDTAVLREREHRLTVIGADAGVVARRAHELIQPSCAGLLADADGYSRGEPAAAVAAERAVLEIVARDWLTVIEAVGVGACRHDAVHSEAVPVVGVIGDKMTDDDAVLVLCTEGIGDEGILEISVVGELGTGISVGDDSPVVVAQYPAVDAVCSHAGLGLPRDGVSAVAVIYGGQLRRSIVGMVPALAVEVGDELAGAVDTAEGIAAGLAVLDGGICIGGRGCLSEAYPARSAVVIYAVVGCAVDLLPLQVNALGDVCDRDKRRCACAYDALAAEVAAHEALAVE